MLTPCNPPSPTPATPECAESGLERMARLYGTTVRFVNGVHGLFEPFITDIIPDYNVEKGFNGNVAVKYLSQAGRLV